MRSSRKNESNINIVYQNVRGLKTRLKFWRETSTLSQADLIAVTETNLDESISDNESSPYGWNVIRRDRTTRGGGVLLAARPGVQIRRKVEFETTLGEDLWASVTCSGREYLVCVVYLKPTSTDSDYMTWFCKVEANTSTLRNDLNVIIVGDMNLNSSSLNINNYMGYFLSSCNLTEHNEVVNEYGSKLDVVLVSAGTKSVTVVGNADETLVDKIDKYHPPLDINIFIAGIGRSNLPEPSNIDSRTDWNYSRADFDTLYELIVKIDWNFVLKENDVDKAVKVLYDLLYACIDLCVPKKNRKAIATRRYPIWYTREMITDIALKASLHKIWKTYGDPHAYRFFSALREDLKLRSLKAYNSFMDNIQADLKKEPRNFWSHISNLRTRGGFEPHISHAGVKHSGKAAADAFAEYFSSVFLPQVPDLNVDNLIHDANNYIVDVSDFNKSEVEFHIDKLKARSATGPDNVPAYIIKAFKKQLARPLTHIFQLSLKTGTYPKLWKITRVSPIPKNGDKSMAENYRPIAVLSSFAKIFESLLRTKIYKQVQPYWSEAQHAFISGRSVNTNLLTLTNYISDRLDKKSQVDVAYLDFKKAFDQVDNNILLTKLSAAGFTPRLLLLFADYLRDRKQFVRLGCYESAPYHTRSGVSQGSLLGPLLFCLMVNDLPTCPKSGMCLLYADDLKLVGEISCYRDCDAFQQNLDSIQSWSNINHLYFNYDKCQVMSFTRSTSPIMGRYQLNGKEIYRSQKVKDLGIVFDPKLTFHNHIQSLVKECFKKLGFVTRNCRDFSQGHVIGLLYTSLVRSKLEYGAPIWNPNEKKYILMLEQVQKRFLRFYYKKRYGYYPFMYPTKFLQGTLGYVSLETRRLFYQVMTLVQILRGEVDSLSVHNVVCQLHVPDLNGRSRRYRLELLAAPAARTEAHRQSCVTRAMRAINELVALNPQSDLFADKLTYIKTICMTYCDNLFR